VVVDGARRWLTARYRGPSRRLPVEVDEAVVVPTRNLSMILRFAWCCGLDAVGKRVEVGIGPGKRVLNVFGASMD
jgi:hypothetical protein